VAKSLRAGHCVKAAISEPRSVATMDEKPIFNGSKLIAGGFNVEFDVD
jgi:uncharacterized protein YbaA (DUF1428 family)